MNAFIEILNEHYQFRSQIFKLAKSDIIKTYRGAALGWLWAIIKPATTLFVFWFAFALGVRKGKPINGYPFFYWMIAGFIPWFYMRECLSGGTASIRKYKYLVKRIKFPVSTIPTFVSISNLAVNLCLQLIMVALFIFHGDKIDVYYSQIILINIFMFIFWTAWSLFGSMLSAMSADFLNLVKASIQALFWLSGVLYQTSRIKSHLLRDIMLWNPVTITANAYRRAIMEHRWIWEAETEMRNYLIVMTVMICLAVWSYWRLKKDIPDVL